MSISPHDRHPSTEAPSLSGAAAQVALQHFRVPGCVDAFYPSNDVIDCIPQCIWRYGRLVPDRVLPGLVIEVPLAVDVNIEFKSNIVI